MGLGKLVDLFLFPCGKGTFLHDTLNKQIFRTLFQGQKRELLRLFFFHDRNSFGSRSAKLGFSVITRTSVALNVLQYSKMP